MKRDNLKLMMDVLTEARTCLQGDLARHPNWADLHHLSALLQLVQGQLATAESALQRALEINARYAGARSTLAHLYVRRQRYDQASEIYAALGPDDPSGTNGEYGQALVAMGRGRFDEALERMTKAVELTGRRVSWLHRMGVIERRMGRMAECLKLWREAAADPIVARLYERAGLNDHADPEEDCLDRIEALVSEHPGFGDLEDYLGRICARNRLWSEAAEAYRRAYLIEGIAVRYETRCGFLAGLQGDDSAALACYTRAVEADAKWAPARVALGFEYSAQGDAERATEQFEEASRLRPRWADVQYNLGLLHGAAGRLNDARERFMNALAINPNYAHAQASLAFTCYRLGEMAEARKEFDRAVTLGVRSSDLLVHLALCHRELGDMNKAIEALGEAVALNPNDEMAHYHLGFTHHVRGSRRKAIAAWKQFLSLAQKGPLYDEIEAQLRNGTDD
jgi:tetratricopeptide (TPR) repeat protein